LRINGLEICNNDIEADTWENQILRPGVINVQHQYKDSLGLYHKLTVHNNTIDMRNSGLLGVALTPDWGTYGVYGEIYSNTIRNCGPPVVDQGQTLSGRAIRMGFFQTYTYQAEGFIRNNIIDSTNSGIHIGKATNFEISGNTISNLDRRGIVLVEPVSADVGYNLIYSAGSGNETWQSGGAPDDGIPDAGIIFKGTDTYTMDVDIYSNRIWDIDGKGIAAADFLIGSLVSISNNTIGTAGKFTTYQGIGIAFKDFTTNEGDLYIIGNTIRNSKDGGIGMKAARMGLVGSGEVLVISENVIFSNESMDVDGGGGIGFKNHKADTTIQDNFIYSNKASDARAELSILSATRFITTIPPAITEVESAIEPPPPIPLK
jgi:parallel beta-helix repeat protein